MVSRESPVTLVNLRPSSGRNAMSAVFIGPIMIMIMIIIIIIIIIIIKIV